MSYFVLCLRTPPAKISGCNPLEGFKTGVKLSTDEGGPTYVTSMNFGAGLNLKDLSVV